MKILIFNWRDIKNPTSGGAEVLTHEIAKRWVASGHEVTLFASYYDGAKRREVVEGIHIMREGSPDLRSLWKSVHYKAFLAYQRTYRGNIDLVIDEIHGMPFFTALYVAEPIYPLICEVADTIWDKMFSFPWNKIGKFLEHHFLLLYKKRVFLTISESSKADLVKQGIPAQRIMILPMGITRVKINKVVKEKQPTVIFVARINKMKGVEDAILAMRTVVEQLPDARLWVVGRGDKAYIGELRTLIEEQKLTKNIIFWNFIPQKKKFELMAKAHIIISPSVREGFGLTIPEAGAVGTPAIVYNVPGLRDVVDGTNGIKLAVNTPEELAKQIIVLLTNKEMYSSLRAEAIKSSKQYDWDTSAETALHIFASNA